ncbi:hypothetical protein GCM10022409_11600 [Hymenobacter glaciei]|uniref:Polysaccharide biosynthesis protein C-terminal domain-containing protein n=1 Tax=Hymenobacter glaciei TaxID=877209 RepID=A0ABP7TPI4_9BACT
MNVLKIIKSSPAFVLPAVINLISLVAFTRLLSLENYGRLSLALVSIEFLQGILYMWVNMCVMRFNRPEDKFSSIGVGLHFNASITALLLAAGVVMVGYSLVFGGVDLLYLEAILLGVVSRGVGNFMQDCHRIYFTDLKPYTKVTVLANACYYLPAVLVLLLRRHTSINELLLIQVSGLLLFEALLLLRHFRVVLVQLRRTHPWSIYQEFLKYGLPLVVSYVALSMFVRIDRFIVQHNVGAVALGTYSAAFSLSNLAISSFFLILTLPTYPEIMKKFNAGDSEGALAIYRKNGRIILLVSGPLLLFSYLFSEQLCELFFGSIKGAKVAVLFPWVILSTFMFNYKVHYYDQVYQFYKKTNVAMLIGVSIGAAHLGVGYLLSRAWGARGVSISGICLSSLAIAFTLYYRHYRLREQPQALVLQTT